MRSTQSNKWQWGKVGNGGDPNSYVHEDSNKKDVRTCTNTTLGAEGKSRKVTQPPNVTQSYSTLSRKCNERRGNKQPEHEERNNEATQTKRESKTLLASDGMVAAKQQISHNRDSSENAAEHFVLDFYRENRHDVDGDKYRLCGAAINRGGARMVEHLNVTDCVDECYAQQQPPTTTMMTTISTESRNRDLSANYQMPSSSSCSPLSSASSSSCVQRQQQHVPVSLTNNLHAPSSAANSSVLFCRNDFDYQLKKNVVVDHHHHSFKPANDIECKVDVNNIENDQNRVNVVVSRHVTVSMSDEIDHEVVVVRDEDGDSANSNVKSFQSADKSSSEATSGPLIKADNLIITSAIENLSMASDGTPSKAKYSNDIVTLREKRRRDRRDRRMARTRATSLSTTTNEILPDIHSPPPYADIPPQQIVPSIVSTVPVEDNRYTFSLPLVRR